MIGKVKKWLGIEGVKLELILPDMVFEEVGAVSGKIRFFSKNEQIVERIQLIMIEKYSRGRGKDRLVDEYVLGEKTIEKIIRIPAEEIVEVNFTLLFNRVKSPIDEFGEKNLFASGMVKLAKTLRKVDSEFRLEAEAKVQGTALNPFDRKVLVMNDK